MQISEKPSYKLTDSLLFLFITLVFLVFFILTFKGFDGSDDMHYAMLASQVLHHRFDPFFAADIFTGRTGLIYWQAFLYYTGGINPVMTQSGTLLCSIICCYLIVFRLLPHRTPLKVVLAAAIFYFNPVLHSAVTGIYPDAYIMLGAILVAIRLKTVTAGRERNPFYAGLGAGLVMFLSSLFKEEGIILFAVPAIFALLFRSKSQNRFLAGSLVSAAILYAGYGLVLRMNSGNFFLRLAQISSIQQIEQFFPQKCHSLLTARDLLIRLTYGPWKEAIRQGYFPVVIPAFVLFIGRIFHSPAPASRFDKSIFLVLLFTILYFPARPDQYQPVCPDMRHFLLLLPFGSIVLTECIIGAFGDRRQRLVLLAASALCFAWIVSISLNKWKWLTYGEWIVISGLLFFTVRHQRNVFAIVFLCMIAFLGLERLFFLNSDWYKDLKKIYAVHRNEYAYFPDHDNFMQWRLFGGFADTAVLNLEAVQVPPDLKYGPFLKTFRPGLIIVNRVYSARSPQFFSGMDSLYRRGVIEDRGIQGDVSVYRVNRPQALDSLRALMQQEATR